MRKGIFAVGIVVLLLGVILLAVSIIGIPQAASIPPQSVGGLTINPQFIGSGSVNLAWSGANAQFRVSVYSCGSSQCTSIPSANDLVADGAGGSGSLSFTATGGQYYLAVSNPQTSITVPVTLTASGGLTILSLVGIALLVVGAVVAFLGVRMKAKLKARAAEEAPQKEMFSLSSTPFTEQETGPAAAAAASTSSGMREREEPTGPIGPVYFTGGEPAPAAGASAPSGSKRAPLKCPSCGAMNDPWLTVCRSCRRPLARTGT
jgi:hypothetical protein